MIENYFAIVLLAFLIIGGFAINLRRERDQARRLAESMKKKLDERPVKIVIYSDDVIHDKILRVLNNKPQLVSKTIRDAVENKEYLKS